MVSHNRTKTEQVIASVASATAEDATAAVDAAWAAGADWAARAPIERADILRKSYGGTAVATEKPSRALMPDE